MEIEFIVREAKKEEAIRLRSASRRELTLLEGLFSPKPKHALVVETTDGKFAGSGFYTIIGKGFGYIDIIYVLKEYHGKGAAQLLYQSLVDKMKELGCDKIFAMAIDDNAPSFKSFEKVGLNTVNFSAIKKAWGLEGITTVLTRSPATLAAGCRILANIEKPIHSANAISWFVKLALCFCVTILVDTLSKGVLNKNLFWFFPAILSSLLFMTLGSLVGNLLSKRPFVAYEDSAGLLTSLLVSMSGAIFPPMLRLYPKEWKNDDQTRRQLGLSALFAQLFCLIGFVVCFFFQDKNLFLRLSRDIFRVLCLYNALPFFPFSVFGTKAMWSWNKVLCLLLIIANVTSIIVLS